MDPAVLEKIEEQRQTLEVNITNLRKSLRHWQNVELDYEGLREEFEILPENASGADCLRVAREFNPVLVDENDLLSMIDNTKTDPQPSRQLADLLSKRVDYVSKNADSLRKQIAAEEKKLNALLLVEDPTTRDDAGLPLTEIIEELDDDGNVISSKVERPGAGAAGLAEVLEKAGVEGVQSKGGKVEVMQEPPSAKATIATSSKASSPAQRVEDSDLLDSERDSNDALNRNLPVRIPTPGENPIPVLFRDTEEEARMRREMLEYGLDEVGAIVAEIDLQEGESDVSYDEDDENLIIDSDFDEADDDESEDEFGRVKNPVISEKYKQKMEELEKKLGLTDLKNLGPSPELPANVQEALDRPPAAEAARKAAIARSEADSQDAAPVKRVKKAMKSVAFAEGLDIAKEVLPKSKPTEIKDTAVNPIGEAVIERPVDQTTEAVPPPVPTSTKPASRFKAARQHAATQNVAAQAKPAPKSKIVSAPPPNNNQNPATSSSKDRPLVAPQVLERPTSSTSKPPDLDTIDDEMHRREIALEYHKLRNRKIHAQGGFVRDDSDEEDMDDMLSNNVFVDEETGEVRKVSRFKAARLMY